MNSKEKTENIGYMMNPQNFSVNDGEGIRTVLFLTGCPLRCKWCANPESFTINKKNDFVLPYTVKEVLEFVDKQKVFYRHSGGGVTFSGGEATVQIDFLRELVNKLYDDGLHLAIETSGYFVFEEVEDILKKMDHIFVDVKHMNTDVHKRYTSQNNNLILKNIEKMNSLSGEIIIRIPLIEGVNASEENIRETAIFIKKTLKKPKIELLPYHELGTYKYKRLGLDYDFQGFSRPSDKKIEKLEYIFQQEGVEVVSYL
jgi:pyruvate formate lyase activating enzyme